LGHTVVRRLSPFVRQIDFALDWNNYESGRAIYRQGDPSDSTYIVLSGRLRSVVNRADGKKELIGEYGRGDLVGIVELLTMRERSTTIVSVRDSELAKLPSGLLHVIKIKYPVVVTRLIQLLGHRILGSIEKVGQKGHLTPSDIGSRPSGSNFATVALVAISDDVPLSAFALELNNAITPAGPSLLLTSDFVRKTLGPSVLDTVAEYRLSMWLAQQEDRHRIVLYQCDSSFSNWTQRCIRQSDCILIVGLAENEATVGKIEKQLEQIAVRTQKELVLLHRQDAERPKNTVKWLNMRSWCSSFHHIRCPNRVFRRTPIKPLKSSSSDPSAAAVVLPAATPPDIHSDVARLGRFLTGTSIGLVLGGGGARGAAHVGMIKAIRESGIPIDMVGGTSIGAFMGALWCQELDVEQLRNKGRSWAFLMTSVWRQILDLTYPASAMFTGAGFNRTIFDTFGDGQIEDLWLPYFTVTTDITSSEIRVHRFGSLWRYVRASMSLSGYLPPMCDPVDGHLLLDGGYVNNLPADVMREVMGAETILAVDVGSQDDTDISNYGDELNGWWLLWNRWNPFSVKVKVPTLPEIQQRLAYVSCVRQLEEVKRSDYCTYIRPPIDQYKTLQFASFDAIQEIGYNHGKGLFAAMSLSSQKSLHAYLQIERNNVIQQQGIPACKPSFVDLAEKVCRVDPPVRTYSILSDTNTDEDEDEDGLEYYYHSEPEINATASGDEYANATRFAHRKVSTIF
jgi:lysophospholipid hydrolase